MNIPNEEFSLYIYKSLLLSKFWSASSSITAFEIIVNFEIGHYEPSLVPIQYGPQLYSVEEQVVDNRMSTNLVTQINYEYHLVIF